MTERRRERRAVYVGLCWSNGRTNEGKNKAALDDRQDEESSIKMPKETKEPGAASRTPRIKTRL